MTNQLGRNSGHTTESDGWSEKNQLALVTRYVTQAWSQARCSQPFIAAYILKYQHAVLDTGTIREYFTGVEGVILSPGR